MDLNIENAQLKYKELGTLTKVSEFFDVSLESLRQYFIENNLSYKKRGKYECNDNFFSIPSEKSFYWAGFIAADGNIEKGSNRIKIELKSTDKHHLQKFKDDIESTADLIDLTFKEYRPQFKYSEYHTSRIRFNSRLMVQDLNAFNIHPNKSKDYFIPDDIMNHKYINHFIRGLIDGDGHLAHHMNSGMIHFCGNTKCVNQVFDHLKIKLNLESGSCYVREDGLGIFRFGRLKDIKKIIEYLDYSFVSLDRKREIIEKLLNSVPRKIELNINDISTCKSFNDIEKMSKVLNCSTSTIRRRMEENNIKLDNPKILKIETKVSKEQLIEDLKSLNLNQIAKKYEICTITLVDYLVKENIKYNNNMNLKATLTKEILLKSYEKEKSIRGVARDLSITRSSIKAYLRKYNII